MKDYYNNDIKEMEKRFKYLIEKEEFITNEIETEKIEKEKKDLTKENKLDKIN